MNEIFAVNSLGTDTLDITACTADCDTDEDCWMIMFTPPYGCVKLTYNADTLVAGVEASNSPVKILGKFCIEGMLVYPLYLYVSSVSLMNHWRPAETQMRSSLR